MFHGRSRACVSWLAHMKMLLKPTTSFLLIGLSRGGGGWWGADEWQGNEEGRPLSLGRCEPDAPVVPLDQFPAEVQAQACPADFAFARIVCPRKPAEDARLLVSRDADALICYTQHGALRRPVFTQRDVYAASLGAVLDGVVDQVAQHLLDAARVHFGHQVLLIRVDGNAVALGGDLQPG